MSQIGNHLWGLVAGLVTATFLLIAGLLALPRLRRLVLAARWWVTGLVLIATCVLFLFVLPHRYPTSNLPISGLPGLFRNGYWVWLLLFLVVMVGSLISLWMQFRERQSKAAGAGDGPDQTAESEAIARALEEIRLRLEQAGIVLANQTIYLFLAPSSEWVEALVHTAGLQLFAEAPEFPTPIRAYAVSDGVLLGCAGVSAFGTGREDATAQLGELCRQLLAMQPDRPLVRGVVVLFPISWAAQAESVRLAATVREDLRAVERVLKVRVPVFAAFAGMESVPGFVEFMDRLSGQVTPRMLEQRVGFAIPSSHLYSGELVQQGLTWMSEWFDGWLLNLISGATTKYESNGELITLGCEVRRYRKRLKAILESAFTNPRKLQPFLFRGCYFIATGSQRREQGFTAGLLRGARSRILADHVATQWTAEARKEDQWYTRVALAIGVGGGLLSLMTWSAIVRINPWGWLGVIALVLTWVVVLWRSRRAA